MEELIVEAYQKAATKEFFTITTQVERLLKKHYSFEDPNRWEERESREIFGDDYDNYLAKTPGFVPWLSGKKIAHEG